jgi:hypothetical protein
VTARKVTLDDGTHALASGSILYLLYLADGADGREERYPGAYQVRGYAGIAWRVHGVEVETFETEDGFLDWRETGRLVCVMVGDDSRFAFDPDDVTAIDDDAYCAVCGQIGCQHDGRDRSEAAV